jgi:hypothetical protein
MKQKIYVVIYKKISCFVVDQWRFFIGLLLGMLIMKLAGG